MVYHRPLCRQLQCSEQLCYIANWQAHLTVNHQGIRAQILVHLDVLCSNSGNNVLQVWRTEIGLLTPGAALDLNGQNRKQVD